MHHLMLDIETLDTTPSAVLLSVAAVFFEPMTGELGESFTAQVSPQKPQLHRTISADTVAWWAQQSDAARKEAFSGTETLKKTLTQFSRFIQIHTTDKVHVWGNGKEFDCSILEHAYGQLEMTCPWDFWRTQDVRTLVTLARTLGFDPKKTRPFEGVPHLPLDDARHQARYVSDIFRSLRVIPSALENHQ